MKKILMSVLTIVGLSLAQHITIEAESGTLASGASVSSSSNTAGTINVTSNGNIGTATYTLDAASGFSATEKEYNFKLHGMCAGSRPCGIPLRVTLNGTDITSPEFKWENQSTWSPSNYEYTESYTGNFKIGDVIVLYLDRTTSDDYPGNVDHLRFEDSNFDDQNPQLSDTTVSVSAGIGGVVVDLEATDNVGVTGYEITNIFDSSFVTLSEGFEVDENGVITLSAELESAAYTIQVKASDAQGNETTANVTVTLTFVEGASTLDASFGLGESIYQVYDVQGNFVQEVRGDLNGSTLTSGMYVLKSNSLKTQKLHMVP